MILRVVQRFIGAIHNLHILYTSEKKNSTGIVNKYIYIYRYIFSKNKNKGNDIMSVRRESICIGKKKTEGNRPKP